jgi:putative transposase
VWAADICYIPTASGFVHLLPVMDWWALCTRLRLSNLLDLSFCVAAIEEGVSKGPADIFTTDQGSQFTEEHFTLRQRR